MVDMAREMIAVTMGRKTVADVCELLRKGIVNAARDGKTCVINVDKLAPDFTSKYTGDAENFPAATIFNKAEWEKKENYIKIVRESENCSVAGQNPGHYVMQPGFVHLERMVGESWFGLPDVECRAVAFVDVHTQIVIGAIIVRDRTYRVAEKFEHRPKEFHGRREICDRSRSTRTRPSQASRNPGRQPRQNGTIPDLDGASLQFGPG